MEISLTPDIAAVLVRRAREQGISLEQLVLESLRQRFVAPDETIPTTAHTETLADFLADSIGVLNSGGGSRMSEAKATVFAHGSRRCFTCSSC